MALELDKVRSTTSLLTSINELRNVGARAGTISACGKDFDMHLSTRSATMAPEGVPPLAVQACTLRVMRCSALAQVVHAITEGTGPVAQVLCEVADSRYRLVQNNRCSSSCDALMLAPCSCWPICCDLVLNPTFSTASTASSDPEESIFSPATDAGHYKYVLCWV